MHRPCWVFASPWCCSRVVFHELWLPLEGLCLLVGRSLSLCLSQVLAPSSCIRSTRGSVAFPWTPMTSRMPSCLCRGPRWLWGLISTQVTCDLKVGHRGLPLLWGPTKGWRGWGRREQGRGVVARHQYGSTCPRACPVWLRGLRSPCWGCGVQLSPGLCCPWAVPRQSLIGALPPGPPQRTTPYTGWTWG